MKISLILTTALLMTSQSALAQSDTSTVDNEILKRKIVSRLYQVTYGSSLRCQGATDDAKKEQQTELSKFIETYPVLMKQVTESKYYEPARVDFEEFVLASAQRDTTESLSSECEYSAYILRELNAASGEQGAPKKYERILAE